MRQNCKKRIVNLIREIKAIQANKKCSDIMLIIDEFTTPLLNSVVVEFFSLGVKNITKVSLKKKPQPKFAGLYFISEQSISTIVQDFKNGPIYHSINILLCEEITKQIMKKISDQKLIIQRLAFFGQLIINVKYPSNNISMICYENSLFSSFLKGEPAVSPHVLTNRIYDALVSGFDNNFRLKLYYGHNKYIQKVVQEMSAKYATIAMQKSLQIQFQNKQPEKQLKTLNFLLIDRKSDLVSPLVSNFYYLNMISDIFQVDFQKKQAQLRSQKIVNINYDDPIFSQYRYLHISKVPALIQPNFKEFKTSNKAAQLSQDKGNGNIASMDLKQIIRDIPEFNKKVKSYEEQIQIVDQITKISKEGRLADIGQIQQMIVSGIDGHCAQIPDKRILERTLQFTNGITDSKKIVRILTLVLFCLSLSENQKKSILNKIKFFPQFTSFGRFLQEKLSVLVPKPMKLKISPQRQRSFLHLHQSLVESIMIEILERQVSKQVNLKVLGQQVKKQSKFQKIAKKQQRHWVICILGGISLNQIVQIQRLKMKYQNLQISFICTEILTTWNYLQKIQNSWIQ